MALATLSARVDSENKKEFEQFCEDTGMNVSVCINMFVKEVLRHRKLPFEVSADPFYSAENMAELKRRIDEVKSGKSELKEHELIEVD
ncbi:MAG: type II toxin-antitoxin system RelB/DinJ family antitoxin [Lachnospiraceae bacterium]|nr:type II toxin-antitoxin system RelB/DinJ family antitoxin [Lachnospiraceae bacterium]